MNQAEVSNLETEAQAERRKALAKPGVTEVCGAIIEAGDPTGSLNLRVRQAQIRELAAQYRAKKAGR